MRRQGTIADALGGASDEGRLCHWPQGIELLGARPGRDLRAVGWLHSFVWGSLCYTGGEK